MIKKERSRVKNQETSGRSRGDLFLSISFLLAVICFEVWAVSSLYFSMTKVNAIPVKQIQIDGELHYLTKSEIEQYVLNDPNASNLLTMELVDVRHYMESIPWIYQVFLRKKLPNVLLISIVEEKPIAFFNDGILTNNWNIIHPDLSKFDKPLVRLYGQEDVARQIYDKYVDFNNYLAPNGFYIVSISLTNNYMWKVKLNNGILLNLGRETENVLRDSGKTDVLVNRLRKFVESFEYLNYQNNIEYIDLRYDTGIAVKWKEASNENG